MKADFSALLILVYHSGGRSCTIQPDASALLALRVVLQMWTLGQQHPIVLDHLRNVCILLTVAQIL